MIDYDNFDAILFDMDGTIFDSEAVHRDAWKMTAKDFGQEFTDQMYLQFIGMTTPDCMKTAMEWFNHEIELQAFSDGYYANLKQLLRQAVPLKKGFLSYFQALKALNKPMAIVTSSAVGGVASNFAHYDFKGDFAAIVTRDDVENFKPHPEPYLLACQKLGVEPKRAIVFEDSNTGAVAGLDAGCFTVGIPDLVSFNAEVAKRLNLQVESFQALF